MEGISKSQVSVMAKSLDAEVAAFRSRPLAEVPYPYLWLDALYLWVREEGRSISQTSFCFRSFSGANLAAPSRQPYQSGS